MLFNYINIIKIIDFNPILMEKESDKDLFCYRMIPPNRTVKYFFTNPV